MAKRLAYMPPTPKLAGSKLSENLPNAAEISPQKERVNANALPKAAGFLRLPRFPPTGKVVTEWVRQKGAQ